MRKMLGGRGLDAWLLDRAREIGGGICTFTSCFDFHLATTNEIAKLPKFVRWLAIKKKRKGGTYPQHLSNGDRSILEGRATVCTALDWAKSSWAAEWYEKRRMKHGPASTEHSSLALCSGMRHAHRMYWKVGG